MHTLSGHTNAVATVKCQAAEPQIITGMVGVASQVTWLKNLIIMVCVH